MIELIARELKSEVGCGDFSPLSESIGIPVRWGPELLEDRARLWVVPSGRKGLLAMVADKGAVRHHSLIVSNTRGCAAIPVYKFPDH